MWFYHMYLFVLGIIMLTPRVSSRAVNISNTWMLPEEGFPVFYRYFRDRISWYEADAVCQFHHANLVTADSTQQYDAIRAYLKELDIAENIWIGLSRTSETEHFTWTNFHPLNGDGHWQQLVPKGNNAVCVAMDPAADFLWRPMSCGGPDVASFICELPVPSWAMGPKGCLFTELPSLTVLYIPEQLALELTSDCGLDGTKRVLCKGNADREEILKQLTCAISPEDFITSPNTIMSDAASDDILFNGKTTKPWIWTSNTVDTDYGMPTRHRRETEDTISPLSTKSTTDISSVIQSINRTAIISTTVENHVTTGLISSESVHESTVLADSEKSVENQTTEVTDSSFSTSNGVSEGEENLQENISVTAETKVTDLGSSDSDDFSSAIGQGQLFSIIENGTMFDLIEVNETESDDSKFTKEVIVETPLSETEMLRSSTDSDNNNFYTTVIYHKEPPSQTNFVTNKSVKKVDTHPLKHVVNNKKSKDSSKNAGKPNITSNSLLTKEVEIYPITDSLVKLNRTFRKGLALQNKSKADSDKSETYPSKDGDHQHVEIKWHKNENDNLVQMQFLVTTKRFNPSNSSNLQLTQHGKPGKSTEETTLGKTSTINPFNSKNVTDSSELEKNITLEEYLIKKQFLPKSLIGQNDSRIEVVSVSSQSNEFLEEPQVQPRPNRQRQLTRPQRRSFYPYFFSRVLG